MNVLDKIKARLDELDRKRQEALEELQKDFPSLFTELFAQSKLIESLGWTQYTPYFMDGDECIFGVNIDEVYINGQYYDELDWTEDVLYTTLDTEEKVSQFNNFIESPEGAKYKYLGVRKLGHYGYLPNPDFNAEEAEIINQIKNVLSMIPEQFFKDLFGDHIKVTLHSDGTISSDHYSHE